MKSFLSFLTFIFAVGIVAFTAGCGGGGGGSHSSSNPFSGIYQATFSRSIDSCLFVVIDSHGVTYAAVSDETGIVAEGEGTTDAATGDISVAMDGTAGATTLTGTFTRSPGGSVNMDGGVNANDLHPIQTGNNNSSSFAGKYKVQYSGSQSGELTIVISNDRKIYKKDGSTNTYIGTIDSRGKVTLSGEGIIPSPPQETDWEGSMFLVPGSMGGSGSWADPSDEATHGSWTAIPDLGNGTPVFNHTTLVKGLSVVDFPSFFAGSPNGHMVGACGSHATYWANPTADPVILNNPAGTNISWPTAVNESGATVGYCYNTAAGLGTSKAVIWPAGSQSPVELPLPDEYVSGIASGINSSGVIVGLIRKDTGATKPCIWTSASSIPFIPPQGDAVSISEAGIVLCQANHGYLPTINASNMIQLNPPAGYGSVQVEGMGANGIICGTAILGGDGIVRPVAWNPLAYAPVALAYLAGFQSMEPFAAGTDGTFTGRAFASGVGFQAIYWSDAIHALFLNDIVADNINTYNGGQYIFADGSIIVYGRDPSNSPILAWLQK